MHANDQKILVGVVRMLGGRSFCKKEYSIVHEPSSSGCAAADGVSDELNVDEDSEAGGYDAKGIVLWTPACVSETDVVVCWGRLL